MEKFNVAAELTAIREHFRPKVVAKLNGQEVKLSKTLGEFIWHHHDDADSVIAHEERPHDFPTRRVRRHENDPPPCSQRLGQVPLALHHGRRRARVFRAVRSSDRARTDSL